MHNILLMAAWVTSQVYPYGHEKILPDGELPACAAARETRVFEASAAKGEFETVAFVFRSDADLKDVDFVPGELKGPGGATIPASALDVYVVKEWFRGKSSWTTDRFSGGAPKDRELTPDMILHDDKLIKLDEDPSNRVNYLRVDYPSGTKYLDMCRPGRKGAFNYDLHPVRDAKRFVPMDFAAGRRRQIFVRIHVPADAVPGDYTGALAMKFGDADQGALELRLKVYPFELPHPMTHYDSSKRFFCSMYGGPAMAAYLKAGKNFANAEAKTRAIVKSLVEHNVLYPTGPGEFGDETTDDPSVRTLYIMREAGMPCDPIFDGGAVDIGWFVNDGHHETPEQNPQSYTNALERFGKSSDRQLAICEKVLGHRNRWSTGWDEADVWGCRQQFGFWKRIKDHGGDVASASGVAGDVNWMLGVDHSPACCSWGEAARWHAGGALVVDYAATFWGPECPDIWRRTMGIRFWFNDFDGHHNLGLCFGKNRWNDMIWREDVYRQFGCAFLTIDGMIETVALEAFREALDDIRYFTLHRLLCEKAMASSDGATKAFGRKELLWMELCDPEKVVDLDAFRRETVVHILALQEKVGEIAVSKPKPLPPLPPDNFAARVKESDPYKRALAFKAADRYDLAFPELAKARADAANLPVADFLQIVGTEVGMRLEVLDRKGAVELLDGLLKRKDVTGAAKGRLMLQKVQALLTDEAFEEIYTRKQLEEASEQLKAALKMSGVAKAERVAAIQRMVDACNQGGQGRMAIDVGIYHLESTAMDETDKGHLALLVGQGYAAIGDDKQALHYGEQCQRQENGGGQWGAGDNRACCRLIANSAMRLGKWKQACGAWETMLPMINREEEKPLYESVKANIVKCSAELRKNTKSVESLDDTEEAAGGIDLDE